jgi:hypothetical protein
MEGECGDKRAGEEASHEEDEYACIAVDHPRVIAAMLKRFYKPRPLEP